MPVPTSFDGASRKAPELIAPAGDRECAKAAVENGADGIYFGLQSGLNARARAANFAPDELPELMTYLRRRGVKGYLTLNTLVFPEELEAAEASIRLAAASGVDAIIIQDLGLLRLAHRICPCLPLHASTQMTLSSAECIEQVVSSGVTRVVLPRELSLAEIARIRRQTAVELEVFVHGALCIGYSGQCLASLALGGRSGNRGQCAQACRLKYELIATDCRRANGVRDFVDEKKYIFSPCDLAAFDLLPELIAAGVSALKIEGRMKEADYVAVVTRFYRRAVDEAAAGRRAEFSPAEIAELEAAFSRGFSHGWLEGPRHQTLVAGESSAKRGVLLGEVRDIRGDRVRIAPVSAVRRGMGVVFEGDRATGDEQGGRIFEIFAKGRSVEEVIAPVDIELAFRHDSLDFARIAVGQKVWKTDDPRLAKKWRQIARDKDARRRVPLDLSISAIAGKKLTISGRTPTGAACRLESPQSLPEAQKHPLSEETLRAQLGRLGGTIYELRGLDVNIIGQPMLPFSELGKLRRAMIAQLDASLARPAPRELYPGSAVDFLRKKIKVIAGATPGAMPTLAEGMSETGDHLQHAHDERGHGTVTPFAPNPPQLHVLCRSLEQIEAAVAAGASGVIADFRDVECCAEAIRIARKAGCEIWLATLRIHRPGDAAAFAHLERLRSDGILGRNLAALAYFHAKKIPVAADFSLNAANELAVFELLRLGACRVATAYDLRPQSLGKLLETAPPHALELILHAHVPMFHTAHCLFCAELSTGRDATDCGRPCRNHRVRVRDRLGVEHLLLADADCRNTLYHAIPQNAAEVVPEMLRSGVRRFRLELLEEDARQTRRLIEIYRELLADRVSARDAASQLKPLQHNR
ncbi:MAG: U32 family peptidase [Pirellulales bacterium]|nr:U32 family peptidase [Pirellulales bacterium]